ncbi:unnamed protein product [Symbiodinium sp. CCMP2592]|nr:unnamed protein product [Symbiodinium sp. CCMP2592]
MQYLLQHSRFCGLKCDAVTLVRLLRAYVGMAYNRAPRSGDLVQQCHVGRTQADHFLAVLREVEAARGRSWKAKIRVSGLVEVDGTSLGKFAVRATCKRFQPQIKALTAKLARTGKVIPSVFFVHYQVLGIMRRGGPPILAIPDLPVTVPGSRPPTESFEGIRQTGLLHKVPLARRPFTTIFSDGNRAWQTLAQQLRMTSHAVCHQSKEWTRTVQNKHWRARHLLCGTQTLDRAWQSLKDFVGPKVSRKTGHGQHAHESFLVRDLISQFMYRQSMGNLEPGVFLLRLGEAFRVLADAP